MARLVLEDGSIFEGQLVGQQKEVLGEVVFNTSHTGYQEVLTDPSYTQQIVAFTASHIGNTGINSEDFESNKVYAAGLVAKSIDFQPRHWRAEQSLPRFLEAQGKTAIVGIDTRKLARLLHQKGAQRGLITPDDTSPVASLLEKVRALPSLSGANLASGVSTQSVYEWKEGLWQTKPLARLRIKVAVYDFGVKRSILRHLYHLGLDVVVVPSDYPLESLFKLQIGGVVLSNGPGDPAACTEIISQVRELLQNKTLPIFGICLGHQLMALASGAQTVKMKFGQHGTNQPVFDQNAKRVWITSQNHGFAVDESTLPKNMKAVSHALFDGSLQGFEALDAPHFAFQGHPEAGPGPCDPTVLFHSFVSAVKHFAAL